MIVSHAEACWRVLPDIRSDEQREADREIDRACRDEPDQIERLDQDMIALRQIQTDLLAKKNNQPARPCPVCRADELARRDLVAEATLRVITGRLRKQRSNRRSDFRVLAGEREPLLAIA